MKPRLCLVLAALVYCAMGALSALSADEVDDLFQTPTEDVGTTGKASSSSVDDSSSSATQVTETAAANPSVLGEYKAAQDKLSFSWSLTTGGGLYVGWKSLSALSNPLSKISHNAVGSITLTSTIDVRPFDYLRLHESSSFTYAATDTFVPSWPNELFFDYSLPSGLAVRIGKYSFAWGNARILGIANIAARTIDLSDLSSDVDIEPSWLKTTKPSMWTKGVLPIGNYTATAVMSLPNATTTGLSQQGFGLLNEFILGKTSVGLSGFYQYGYTPRCALTLKTSAWNIDFFADSCLAFPTVGGALPSIVGGLYYVASSGPDIKVTAELRWNGESASSGALVGDALALGGLSQAIAGSWSSVGGSNLTLGGTWYQDWTDGSGAIVPYFSYSLAPALSLKGILPFVYGSSGSYYVTYPPSEAYGYALGGAIMLVLSTSF